MNNTIEQLPTWFQQLIALDAFLVAVTLPLLILQHLWVTNSKIVKLRKEIQVLHKQLTDRQ